MSIKEQKKILKQKKEQEKKGKGIWAMWDSNLYFMSDSIGRYVNHCATGSFGNYMLCFVYIIVNFCLYLNTCKIKEKENIAYLYQNVLLKNLRLMVRTWKVESALKTTVFYQPWVSCFVPNGRPEWPSETPYLLNIVKVTP